MRVLDRLLNLGICVVCLVSVLYLLSPGRDQLYEDEPDVAAYESQQVAVARAVTAEVVEPEAAVSCCYLCEHEGVGHECSVDEAQLAASLQGELAAYAGEFIRAGEDYGICPYFLASVCALESGWGEKQAAPNNVAGLRNSDGFIEFETVPQCIWYLAALIERCYLEGGTYYSGSDTVAGVSVYYNLGNEAWVDAVLGITTQLEGEGQQ